MSEVVTCLPQAGRIVYAVVAHLNQKWERPRARLKGFAVRSLKAA